MSGELCESADEEAIDLEKRVCYREFTKIITNCIAIVRTFVYNRGVDEYHKTERSF